MDPIRVRYDRMNASHAGRIQRAVDAIAQHHSAGGPSAQAQYQVKGISDTYTADQTTLPRNEQHPAVKMDPRYQAPDNTEMYEDIREGQKKGALGQLAQHAVSGAVTGITQGGFDAGIKNSEAIGAEDGGAASMWVNLSETKTVDIAAIMSVRDGIFRTMQEYRQANQNAMDAVGSNMGLRG